MIIMAAAQMTLKLCPKQYAAYQSLVVPPIDVTKMVTFDVSNTKKTAASVTISFEY